MRDTELFRLALGIQAPWYVRETVFDAAAKRLDLYLDFPPGSSFPCPECSQVGKVHDTAEKTWRHLNFFQHEAFLHARVPRLRCPEHGVRLVSVPWGRSDSGFTLLFEALVMMMVQGMPVNAVAQLLGVTDKRLWRVVEHYVSAAVEAQDLSSLTAVGVDETACARGHHYVSLFADQATGKVVYVTEGRDSSTVERFAAHLEQHGGAPEALQEVTCDMSPAFISGVQTSLPKASITFDKFHVVKLLNEAVDEVRREERRSQPLLKTTRYLWLKNPRRLTKEQALTVERLSKRRLKTARAYRMRLVFQELFTLGPRKAARELERWRLWALRSRLEPLREFAKTLKTHWDGVLRWFKTRLTNGLLEGLNSLVQAAKARARGYRSVRYFKIMIYLIAGKLGVLPT